MATTLRRQAWNMARALARLLLPLVSAWVPIAYFHAVFLLYYHKILISLGWAGPLFIPTVLYETLATRWFAKNYGERRASGTRFRGAFVANVLMMAAGYCVLLILPVYAMQTNPWFKFLGYFIWRLCYILCRSVGIFAIISIAWFLTIYIYITIKNGKLRIFISLGLPAILLFIFFIFQLKTGGMGAASVESVIKKKGIEYIYGNHEIIEALSSGNIENHKCLAGMNGKEKKKYRIKIVKKPRSVIYSNSNQKIYSFYGAAWMPDMDTNYQIAVQFDLNTKKIETLISNRNIRNIGYSDKYIYFAPWYDFYIYEIDKREFKINKKIHRQIYDDEYDMWDPVAVTPDFTLPLIYVGTEFNPVIACYNLENGNMEWVIHLDKEGIVNNESGGCTFIVQDPQTHLLYMHTELPGKIVELDPKQHKVLRSMEIGNSFCSFMTYNPANRTFYLQSGLENDLHAVSMDTFQKTRTYKGEYHARRMQVDNRRGVIYVLGYFSGTLFPVDLKTGKRAWSIRVGGRPEGLDIHGSTAYVHSMSGVFRVDLDALWEASGKWQGPPPGPEDAPDGISGKSGFAMR
jgi:outer membrane protein assembly factor BamB